MSILDSKSTGVKQLNAAIVTHAYVVCTKGCLNSSTLGRVLLATTNFSVLASDLANAKFSGCKIFIFPNLSKFFMVQLLHFGKTLKLANAKQNILKNTKLSER